jgi:hypothetical protein
MLNSVSILNLSYEHDLFVSPSHLRYEISSAMAIVGNIKGNTTAPIRQVFGVCDNFPGLVFARDEWNNDCHGTHIKNAGNEVILQRRHSDHWYNLSPC